MFTYKRASRSLALIGASLVLGLWSTGASAQVFVDCGSPTPPNSIQANIGLGNVTINVTGTCNETVFIGQSNVSISGAPSAVITGGLFVDGATRVFLRDLTINNLTGGGSVALVHGAFVQFTNTTMENLRNGVIVTRNSGALFANSTIGPALVDDPATSCALCALDGSNIRLVGTTVTGNANESGRGAAVSAVRNSSIVLRGGNTITNNGRIAAIGTFFDSSLRQDNIINPASDVINGGTDGAAVLVGGLSLADFRQAVVNGDIVASEHSFLRFGSTLFGDPSQLVINGNIDLSFDSGLSVLSPLVTINGDVNCADRESSLAGTFAGGGEINCTGFDPSAAKGGDDEDDD